MCSLALYLQFMMSRSAACCRFRPNCHNPVFVITCISTSLKECNCMLIRGLNASVVWLLALSA